MRQLPSIPAPPEQDQERPLPLNVLTSPILPRDGLGRLLFLFLAKTELQRVVLGENIEKDFFREVQVRGIFKPAVFPECLLTGPADA